MKEHGGDIDLLDVPHADEPSPIEALVASTTAGDICRDRWRARCRGELEIGGGLADVGESADTLQAETTNFKSVAGREIAVIGLPGDSPVVVGPVSRREVGLPTWLSPMPFL